MSEPRIYNMEFGKVYPLYVNKVVRKGRTEEEVMLLINWLTGYAKEDILKINQNGTTVKDFFDQAPKMNERRNLISGSICGVKVQDIEDPLMKMIRQLDKLIDDLAKGKIIEKILP